MGPEERDICMFLRSWPGQYVSAREICRRAGGKWRFRDDPNWAIQILLQLAEKGVLEKDADGHYRLTTVEEREKKQSNQRQGTWVAPHIQRILANGGIGPAKTFELGNPDVNLIPADGKVVPPPS